MGLSRHDIYKSLEIRATQPEKVAAFVQKSYDNTHKDRCFADYMHHIARRLGYEI